jgi:hypothetical protein
MDVVRGKDGTGLYAAKCSNCHQPTNVPGEHMPPGNPKWQLPPEDMKMVFQGKTARQLALQIMNYNQNGHKNKQQLLEHARDTLVKAAWNMGEGRRHPHSYSAFVNVWDTWIKGGWPLAIVPEHMGSKILKNIKSEFRWNKFQTLNRYHRKFLKTSGLLMALFLGFYFPASAKAGQIITNRYGEYQTALNAGFLLTLPAK